MKTSRIIFFVTLLLIPIVMAVSSTAHSQDFRERLKQRIIEKKKAEMQGQDTFVMPEDIQQVSLTVNDDKRDYFVHLPANKNLRPQSALLILHGGGGNAETMIKYKNNLQEFSDQAGFLAVYLQTPQKSDRWLDSRDLAMSGDRDIQYVEAVIKSLSRKYDIDKKRVFATGISNGGNFLFKLACEAPELIKGIAPIASNMTKHLHAQCRPSEPLPVITFMGTDDPLMPFEGGFGNPPPFIQKYFEENNLRSKDFQGFLSAHDTIKFWAEQNKCKKIKNANLPDDVEDGTTVSVAVFYDCRKYPAVLYQINGGGHAWPGPETREIGLNGTTSREIDATEIMVKFFQKYGL